MADYKKIATEARLKILEMIYKAQSSHVGSNLSCIDILSVLFEKADLTKDKILFSKGWVAASAYYFLAQKGVIPKEDLERYCQPGEEQYIGLVEPTILGIWAAGGSVGYGLSFGAGFALSKKLKSEDGMIYILMSDGEMDVGMVWESALIAAHHKLDNLIAIVDYNKFQATGRTNEVLNVEPLRKKWKAFGWNVHEINGHDHLEIEKAFHDFSLKLKPTVIIAHTIKGKGVSFMEDKLEWHYKNIDDESYQKAKQELCI